MDKLVLFCILIFISFVNGQVFIHPIRERPGHEDECYYRLSNKRLIYFKAGTSIYDNKDCSKYSCEKEDGELVLHGTGCDLVVADDHCKIVETKGDPYPGCCPREVCPYLVPSPK